MDDRELARVLHELELNNNRNKGMSGCQLCLWVVVALFLFFVVLPILLPTIGLAILACLFGGWS